MDTRVLQGTNLSISRAALGTHAFGAKVTSEEAKRMVTLSLDRGINHFDTANSYNHGAAEELLGKHLAGRSDVTIATKVFNPMGPGPDDRGLSAAAVSKAIDASLQRLRRDHVDLYYLHKSDRSVPIEETLGALSELVHAGKVRYIGAANHAAWQLAMLRCVAKANAWPAVIASQVPYNLISRRIETEYVEFCTTNEVNSIVFNPLAGGLLTGKHVLGQKPEGDRMRSDTYQDRYWNEMNFEAVAQLKEVALRLGTDLIGLAYGWLQMQPHVDSVLVGASGAQQLAKNLDAWSSMPHTPEVLSAADAIWGTLRGVAPNYNRLSS